MGSGMFESHETNETVVQRVGLSKKKLNTIRFKVVALPLLPSKNLVMKLRLNIGTYYYWRRYTELLGIAATESFPLWPRPYPSLGIILSWAPAWQQGSFGP